MKELKNGIYADDPAHGGARIKGAAASGGTDHSAHSSSLMYCRSWFSYLIQMEDTAPNKSTEKGSVQIDFMTKAELYEEYVTAVKDSKIPGEATVSYAQWIHIWDTEFDVLAIVQYKHVDSKAPPPKKKEYKEAPRTIPNVAPVQPCHCHAFFLSVCIV